MSLPFARLIPRDLAGRAASLSLVSNLGLMVLKIAAGLATGSVAVLSDGIDSAQDVIASAIAFASVRIGQRPADEEHPYGHGRAETLAAVAQALLIGGGALFIAYRSLERLFNPPDDIRVDLGIVAMLIAAGVNFAVVQYVGRVAEVTHSPAIASDRRHLWTNIVQAGAVVGGLVLVAVTGEVAFDSIVALGLAAYLAWTSGSILWSSAGDVLDVSLSADEVAQVEEAILAEGDAITGYHDLRTRRSGQQRYIELHLLLPPKMTVEQSHAIEDRIEARLHESWPDAVVTIHAEPAGTVRADPNTRPPGS